jgi:probable addiction module antidote protein
METRQAFSSWRCVTSLKPKAGVERESLYRALSVRGNPRWSTLVAVTQAIGLRRTVEAAA